MEIIFKELKKLLSENGKFEYIPNSMSKTHIFEAVKLSNKGEVKDDARPSLHLMELSIYESKKPQVNDSNSYFLLIYNSNYAPSTKDIKKSQDIYFRTDISARDLLLKIQDFSREKAYLNTRRALLTDILLNTTSLKELAEKSALVLNNPIIIIDKNFRVLAHSDKSKIVDSYWQNSIKQGFCSQRFINQVIQISEFKEGKKTSKAFYMQCPIDHSEKLSSSIVLHSSILGYITLLDCSNPIDKKDLPLISFLAKLVLELMKRDKKLVKQIESSSANIFTELIDGSIKNKQALDERMQYLAPRTTLPLSLILIDYLSSKFDEEAIQKLKNKIKLEFPKSQIIAYDEYLLIFTKSNSSGIKSSSLLGLMREGNIRAIYSSAISDYLQIKATYKTCIETLFLIKNSNIEGNLFHNDNYKFLHLLYDTEKNRNLRKYCKAQVLEMIEYDKANNTNYYKTLKCYCLKNRNTIDTASALFIHRNTLRYRLKKIEELFDISTEDLDTYFDLLFNIKILDYISLK